MSQKNMVSRRDFLRGAAALGAAGALAACAPSATPKPEAPAATEPPAAGPTEIRWASWCGDACDPFVDIGAEKANVDIINESYPDYTTKILAAFAAGTGPDILWVDPKHQPAFYPRGVLIPWNDYLDERKIDLKRWTSDVVIDMGYKGQIMGLPLFLVHGYAVAVNMDAVRKAGYPEDELPLWGHEDFDTWHWDDFVEAAKACTMRKSDGTYEQFGSAMMAGTIELEESLASHDLHVVDDPWEYAETKSMLDDPEAIAAAHDILDLTLVHEVAPQLDVSEEAQGRNFVFFAGQTAFLPAQLGSNIIANVGEQFEMKAMHLPFVKKRSAQVGAANWCVYKDSPVSEKGQEVCFILSTDHEVLQAMWDTISDLKPAFDADEFEMPGGLSGLFSTVGTTRYEGISQCDYCTEDVKRYPRWTSRIGTAPDIIQSALESAMVGAETIEVAMERAAETLNKEIEENPPV